MDTNLLSNIQKLFSERIDVFSPVEFIRFEFPSDPAFPGPLGKVS